MLCVYPSLHDCPDPIAHVVHVPVAHGFGHTHSVGDAQPDAHQHPVSIPRCLQAIHDDMHMLIVDPRCRAQRTH